MLTKRDAIPSARLRRWPLRMGVKSSSRWLTRAGRSRTISAPMLVRLVLALFVLVGGVASASAEKLPSPASPDARAHLLDGNKAYQLKDFEVAIREYRAGAAIASGAQENYTFWWNLAQSYRMLGRYEDAIWFYRQFLNQAPLSVPLHREAAQKFIDEMQAELEKAASRSEPTDPAPAPIDADRKTTEEPQGLRSVEHPIAGSSARTPWHADRSGWAIAGVGVVGVAVGGGFWLSGLSLADQADGEDRQEVRRSLNDRASTRVAVGAISGGVGIALLAAGVIKLAITPSDPNDVPTLQASFGPSSFGIEGRF